MITIAIINVYCKCSNNSGNVIIIKFIVFIIDYYKNYNYNFDEYSDNYDKIDN